MPAPSITSTVVDQSARVVSNAGIYAAIVIEAERGPINEPYLCTSQTSFLNTFTPNGTINVYTGNKDRAHYEAYKYLEYSNKLWVVRAVSNSTPVYRLQTVETEEGQPSTTYYTPDFAPDGFIISPDNINLFTDPELQTRPEQEVTKQLRYDGKDNHTTRYAACVVNNSSTGGSYNIDGFYNPDEYSLEQFAGNNSILLIYAANAGNWGNDITIKISTEDRALKGINSGFLLTVLHNGTVVETFICSLEEDAKDGYGNNCFVETVLEASGFIRGKVNSSMWQGWEGEKEVYQGYTIGTDNGIFYCTTEGTTGTEQPDWNSFINIGQRTSETECNKGDFIEVTVGDETRFYKCTTAGTTGETEPQWLEGDEFKQVVEDGDAVWELFEGELELSVQDGTVIWTKGKDSLLPEQVNTLKLNGGDNGPAISVGDRIQALNLLKNKNKYQLQLIMDGGTCDADYHRAIDALCDFRNDTCHGILTTPKSAEDNYNSVQAVTDYRNEELNLNSYNCELYTPHQLYYDEFNDRTIDLSAGCYVAGLISKYANELGWHWAVAGYNRGIVRSAGLNKIFETGEVDELSDNQINTIIKDPGAGNVIWDELTLLSKAQDLQDAHISRYINIYLRPAIAEALKPFLFEFNDEATRKAITEMINTFMEPQISARACYAYRVVCDESNNTDSDIQNNILNVWLYIKPTHIAKFIKQKIIITPYSVDLESIEI